MSHAEKLQEYLGMGMDTRALVRCAGDMAATLDEMETRLERLRIFAGFQPDWSPHYDRKQRSGVSEAVKWAERAENINSVGTLQQFMVSLAGGLDIALDKMDEIEAAVESKVDPAFMADDTPKRKRGRPRKDAVAA